MNTDSLNQQLKIHVTLVLFSYLLFTFHLSADESGNAPISDKSLSWFQSIIIQPNGKILAGGSVDCSISKHEGRMDYVQARNAFAVAQYNINGDPDLTFGTNGFSIIENGPTGSVNAVANNSSGQIIAVGNIGPNAVIAAFMSDGHPNLNFGDQGVYVTNLKSSLYHNFKNWLPRVAGVPGSEWFFTMTDVVQSDSGRIYSAGYTDSDFVVLGFETSGKFNKQFGKIGFVTTQFKTADGVAVYGASAHALVALSDERLLVGGNGLAENSSPIPRMILMLAKYKTNGQLDDTFGIKGKVVTEWKDNTTVKLYRIAVQEDGKILLACGISRGFIILRYNSNGTADSAFGNNGLVVLDVPCSVGGDGFNNNIQYIGFQNNKRIVVAGFSALIRDAKITSFAQRFNADGSLDDSFSNHGKLTYSFDRYGSSHCIGLNQNDEIVLVYKKQSYPRTQHIEIEIFDRDGKKKI